MVMPEAAEGMDGTEDRKVIEAAEKVHSDFAENFIRAEVVQAEELIAAGSWLAAKEEGIVGVRGRDYVVKDEDVIEFKV